MDQTSSGSVLALIVSGTAIVLIALIVAARPDKRPEYSRMDRAAYFRSPAWRLIQTLLIGFCFIAAIWHSALKWSAGGPDGITATFLVLVLLVAVVPWVSKIVFPGKGEVDFLDTEAKNDALELEQTTRVTQLAMARAAQFVAELQASLAIQMRDTSTSVADRNASIDAALLFATETLSEWLRPQAIEGVGEASENEPLEEIRVSVWITADNRSRLRFVRGWPLNTAAWLEGLASTVDDGPAGTVFKTGQPLSFQFLPADQRPPASTVPSRPYNGILIAPMFAGGTTIGVLQVEREKIARFDPSQIAIARALAALYATALS